jgi:hypothetical protein
MLQDETKHSGSSNASPDLIQAGEPDYASLFD